MQNPHHHILTHTNTLSHPCLHLPILTNTHACAHSHISPDTRPKTPHSPTSAFWLPPPSPQNPKPQPPSSLLPLIPGPKPGVLVQALEPGWAGVGPLLHPDHSLTLHCALEPEGHLQAPGPVQTWESRARAGVRAVRPAAREADPPQAARTPPGEGWASHPGDRGPLHCWPLIQIGGIPDSDATAKAHKHLPWREQSQQGDKKL